MPYRSKATLKLTTPLSDEEIKIIDDVKSVKREVVELVGKSYIVTDFKVELNALWYHPLHPNRGTEYTLQLEEVRLLLPEEEGTTKPMKPFQNDKDRIKQAVMEEAQNFCDMIDCVDEPPALEYTVTKYGVTVKIAAEIIN